MALLANFFAKGGSLPDGSNERNMNFLVCHIFLMALSMVNVIYLFFIEGLGKRALFKNFLQQLAFFGALMQMASCANSISRYNIQEEYNPLFSNGSSFFGLAAGGFNNIAYGSILFHGCANRKRNWAIFSILLVGASVLVFINQVATFKEDHFDVFIKFNIPNTPFAALCILYTSYSLNKGTVKIDSATISKEAAVRTFLVMGIFLVLDFVATTTKVTIVMLVGGGLNFGCVNVATYYMDHMVGLYEKPVGGEGSSLLV